MDLEARCAAEFKRPLPSAWKPVTVEQLNSNHTKKATGIVYGIEFPWNKETLLDMGAAWLTKAFQISGVLKEDNSVTSLTDVKQHIGGGNCAKLIFDVSYEKDAGGLPTKLFAKLPFPLDGKTMSDRMTSSVYQSGSELLEINASRLLESRLPFPIPRYCFGDCSNETSNWILITERIAFDQKVNDRSYDPAYDKMKDWELKGSADEYYYLLIRIGAKMAGLYKAGKLAPQDELDKFFENASKRSPEAWGVKDAISGLAENEYNVKIKMGADFVEVTAKALFGADIANAQFIKTYKAVLQLTNAYTAEMTYYCNSRPEYVAWSHGNLNVDNVYFWRDAQNKLDVGVLDWGGAQTSSIGWKLWWWLYCCEYDFLNKNIDGMLECFIAEYQANGGPALDKEELRLQFILAAMQQGVGLLGAVPQIYRMCKKPEFATINSRTDERIAMNVDGKNTLRVYIGTFINICNMIKDWGVHEILEKWVDDWTARGSGSHPRKIPRAEIDPAYSFKIASPSPTMASGSSTSIEAPRWKVVGGVEKGGILVREGLSTKSKEAGRLSHAAIVKELRLDGERLNYALITGTGPAEGWVSLSLSGKKLVIPWAEEGATGLKRRPPPWKAVVQPQIEFAQMAEVTARREAGDYYGIPFPFTKDMIVEMGPEWLTQAFHKTGVIRKDNAVTKLSDVREFVGGGAGLKCTFSVEYKEDAPYLHKKLFAKLPHKPSGPTASDRYFVSAMWNHDRPEIIFNIFLSEFAPFRVPKLYYADIAASTTNFITITESIPWADKGAKNLRPGMIEPAYDKYMDWELPDGGPTYYLACCRALGKMAGYHKSGRLHPNVDAMFPMPEGTRPPLPKNIPGLDADTKKKNAVQLDSLIKFVTETAAAVMPDEIKDSAFLAEWRETVIDLMDYSAEILWFASGGGADNPNDWVALTHNNLQIDNAFFWRNDSNEVQVGLLDWGILACGPISGALQGCISGAQVHVLEEYMDAFIQAFLDSYAESGGPRLDFARTKTASLLAMAGWSAGLPQNLTQVLKNTKSKEWAEIKDWMDERLIGRFQTRAHTTQFREALRLWRRWDLGKHFKQWKVDMGLLAKK